MTKPLLRSVPLGRWAESYWTESRAAVDRALASLCRCWPFTRPVCSCSISAVRNGADTWLRKMLDLLGFSQYWLLPVLTISVLLGWHYVTRRPWRVSGYVLYGMVAECVLLAICLKFIVQVMGIWKRCSPPRSPEHRHAAAYDNDGLPAPASMKNSFFVCFCCRRQPGSCGDSRPSRGSPWSSPVLATSLLFAVADHIGPYGEEFYTFTFIFRVLAESSSRCCSFTADSALLRAPMPATTSSWD